MSTRVIHVDIAGQRYAVKSDLDPQYIGELAAYLDQKIQSAARELSSVDPMRVVVIAALNLTDELFRARDDATGLEGHVRSRTADIEKIVDEVLAGARLSAVNE